MASVKTVIGGGLAAAVSATTYLKETFDADWESRWTVGSEWKPAAELGEWKWTGGKYAASASDKGIQTSQDARFYSLTAPLSASFDNKGKDLVISYTVKHEQDLDCGGAYIKLLPPGFDAKKFGGDTPYAIMFGPDVCGYSTKKTHVIFTYKGKNLLTKKNIKCETDKLGHRYTLIVRPDNTYEVQIDGAKVESGALAEDWDFLAPKTIKDPAAKKPSDWVDLATIPDPEDKKPEDWVDGPAKITDPAASKPEDWDDEEDGEWEAPLIDNPAFKGEWKAKQIPNPAYKGVWEAPTIANPDYAEDPELYHVCKPCAAVGFELWQVKSGTIFEDIYVGDSVAEAEKFEDETFDAEKEAEKTAYDAIEAAKKAEQEAANKKREEEAAAAKAAADAKKDEKEDDDDDDDDEKDEL